MDRALEADPGNLEVLLSLGVSHTNELDAAEALSYLHRWITAHPTHGPAAAAAPGPPDSSQRHAYVVSQHTGRRGRSQSGALRPGCSQRPRPRGACWQP